MRYVYLDIETTGLDAFSDRIIMIGLLDDEFKIYFSQDERELIEEFLKDISVFSVIVTFNGDLFDIRFLQTRALKHGLNPVMLKRIRHLDLMWIIKKYLQTQSRRIPDLKEFAAFFGITTSDTLTGKDVVELWNLGNIKAIEEHLKSDLKLVKEIHMRIHHLCDYDLEYRYGKEKEVDEL